MRITRTNGQSATRARRTSNGGASKRFISIRAAIISFTTAIFCMYQFVIPQQQVVIEDSSSSYVNVQVLQRVLKKPPVSRPNPRPAIAWLMSYPNSGTSLTMGMTWTNSNMTVATNYHLEPQQVGFELESVYPSIFSNENESNEMEMEKDERKEQEQLLPPYILRTNLNLPSEYILTKTHCEGYCYGCLPHRWYKLDLDTFYDGCRSNSKTKDKTQRYNSIENVKKMVQIYRDPIDNAVSNFNLQRNEKMNSEERKIYTKDRKGFRKFCSQKDALYMLKMKKSISKEDWEIFEKIPCANSFYRFLHWHDNAISLGKKMDLPVLHLFYEDYGTNIREVERKLFEFLELRSVAVTNEIDFQAGKTYHDYYTGKEHRLILDMVKHFASSELQVILGRYFEL